MITYDQAKQNVIATGLEEPKIIQEEYKYAAYKNGQATYFNNSADAHKHSKLVENIWVNGGRDPAEQRRKDRIQHIGF